MDVKLTAISKTLLTAMLFVALGEGGVIAQSLRPGWGSTPYADASGTGVTFRVWTSNAVSVTVAGTFNGWNMTTNPLVAEGGGGGVWSADVPKATNGSSYKFVFNGSLWRTDPRCRVLNAANSYNSIIVATNGYDWEGDSLGVTDGRDLVIYESHVGTFAGPAGTFATFTNKLDYLRDLGVSAMELMPVNEFTTATSWGYNPAYPFAVESSYGTPDGLRNLVKGMHQRGLAMLLDVVHSHWDTNSSLWHLDGWAPNPAYGGLYFYNSAPDGFTSWGPRPDYSKPEVRAFIDDTFRMWIGEYHINGFRWDAPSQIIRTTNGVAIPDGLMMVTNAVATMNAEHPGTWNIAEDVKGLGGFNGYWDFTFNGAIRGVLTQTNDASRDMPTVARNVTGTFSRVIYTDSHDTAGDLNNGVRLPSAISPADAAGYAARKRSALGAVLVMTSPGTPMILQGQEMLETNQFSGARNVDWSRTNSFAGNVSLYRDLIRLRRNLDGLSEGLLGDSCNAYQVDNVNKLLAYSRWNTGTTGKSAVVIANFANVARTNFSVQFPEAGAWYLHFNSDATNYASDYANFGSTVVNATGNPATAPVSIAPYSALILTKIPPVAIGYAAWAQGITGILTNPTDVAYSDGYANLLKYATGSSPTNSDSLAAMNGDTSTGLFAFRFNRNTNATDITLIAEGANGLVAAPWLGIATNIDGAGWNSTNVTESGTSTPITVTVQDTAQPATNRFLRLRVTRP